jgi:protein-L-isoaspartate(D-aspartate) O-methyltransferase
MPLDNPRVRDAMRVVRREDFLPEPQRGYAGDDRALPLGFGQTCSQPTTVRHLLSLLEPATGHRVLDVGSGSGWSTALLATLVGPTGAVYGVELVDDLVERSRFSLAAYPIPWATIESADPRSLGLAAHAPYDRILVSAESDQLPQPLVDQLTDDGRMVVPVAGRLSVVQRRGPEPLLVERVGYYRFVPLR